MGWLSVRTLLPVLYAGCSGLTFPWEHVTCTNPIDSRKLKTAIQGNELCLSETETSEEFVTYPSVLNKTAEPCLWIRVYVKHLTVSRLRVTWTWASSGKQSALAESWCRVIQSRKVLSASPVTVYIGTGVVCAKQTCRLTQIHHRFWGSGPYFVSYHL